MMLHLCTRKMAIKPLANLSIMYYHQYMNSQIPISYEQEVCPIKLVLLMHQLKLFVLIYYQFSFFI